MASLTLADYARLERNIDWRPYRKLTVANGRKALFDSRVMWMSGYILELWLDRRDRESWRRLAQAVEVVNIESINNQWHLWL